MHRIKRNAHSHANTDPINPFAKRSWKGGKTAFIPDPEDGLGSPMSRPNTIDGSTTQSRDAKHQPREISSLPATSRKRKNEHGSDVADGTLVASPTSSISNSPIEGQLAYPDKVPETDRFRIDSEETHVPDVTEDPEKSERHKKHGKQGFFASFTSKSRENTDDNNGKNKKKKHFTAGSQLKATLFNSWINILLVASPIGFALNYAHANDVAIFVVNFIAIIPLAAMLSFATEEIALRTGEVIGGLLNASFGNAVELIVSIIALAKNQILIVQTSLIGSMLSNLLLVMGMCFFAGGVNRVEQAFNMTVAQTAASLLFLAVSSLLIPTTFNEWANTGTADKTTDGVPTVKGTVELSRATAVLLLIVYACYLFFQLKSHTKMYNAPSEKNEKRDFTKQKNRMKSLIPGKRRRSVETASATNSDKDKEEDKEEEPQLHIWVAVATLAISTVLVAFNAEFLVDSINSITCSDGISKNFVGLILLPIVGNAAEHATAVTVAIKDKMDLAIGVAVGSSMQIALLVLPFTVVLGWIMGKDDMTLFFDGFQIAALFVAVLLVNYLIQDGKSHWLEGVLLMILYIIIAVAAWFYPTAPGLNQCPS